MSESSAEPSRPGTVVSDLAGAKFEWLWSNGERAGTGEGGVGLVLRRAILGAATGLVSDVALPRLASSTSSSPEAGE